MNDLNEIVCMMQISFLLNTKIRRSKGSENEIKPKGRVNYSIDESNLIKKDKTIVSKKLNNTSNQDKKSDKTDSYIWPIWGPPLVYDIAVVTSIFEVININFICIYNFKSIFI